MPGVSSELLQAQVANRGFRKAQKFSRGLIAGQDPARGLHEEHGFGYQVSNCGERSGIHFSLRAAAVIFPSFGFVGFPGVLEVDNDTAARVSLSDSFFQNYLPIA